MNWFASLHFLHRAWRYRLRSEKFGVSFLRSRSLRGKTAIDIGANWGIYSYWMANCVGRDGHVIAFEPQPELARHLHDLREQFRLRNLEIAEAGLSAEDAELTLHRPRLHWPGASFEGRMNNAAECDLIKAQVTTLDGFMKSHSRRPISFIKCDVEGHELSVFQGGRQVLTTDRPDLLFECHRGGESDCEVFEFLRGLDYVGYCFYGCGLVPVARYAALRPRMHRKALFDFVFLPKERAPKSAA